MRGLNLPLDEWFMILPLDVSGCPVSPVHILHHLSFLCTCGKWWCASLVVKYMLIVDDSIYKGLSRVRNLRIIDQWGRCHILLRGTNDLISPMERKPIANMSHQVMSSSPALFLEGICR